MKKRIGIVVIALVLMIGVYQGTMAVIQETTNVNTKMSAGKLGVELIQNGESLDATSNEVEVANFMPGGTVTKALQVKNSKDKELYVRATVTKFWADVNDKKLSDSNAELIELLSANSKDWIIVDDAQNSNNEIIYYYYKKPLKAGESSSEFLNKIKCSETLNDKKYSDYKIKVEVDVEAIQAVGAKDAILSEWGMDVTFDENKEIATISE